MRTILFGRWEDAAAVGLAAGLAILYVSPVLSNIVELGLDWPIASSHGEGVSLSVYGKWWVVPPHFFLTDAYSGDLATFYQYLSDSLCSLIAALLGVPNLTAQAMIYAPLLGFLLLLLTYLALVAVVKDRKVALIASVLVSLGANSHILLPFDAAADLRLTTLLHVPAMTQHLATSQTFGNVLFIPTLALTYVAHRRFTPIWAAGAGFCLGLLFNAHLLTFIHVATVQIAYFCAVGAFASPWSRRKLAWLMWLLALGLVFICWSITQERFPFLLLASLGALVLVGTFVYERDRRPYIWMYATFGLLALPYLLALSRDSGALKLDMTVGASVTLFDVASFFGFYFLAAMIGWIYCRNRSVLLWLGAMIGVTFLLGYNHLWGWHNHPYRFMINLIFPLAVLTALAIRHGPGPISLLMGAVMAALVANQVVYLASDHRIFGNFNVASSEEAALLRKLEQITSEKQGERARIMNPPEFDYPKGALQNGYLLSYSHLSGFVPDFRYVLSQDRYRNRLALFCFLFPGYPAFDKHTQLRACDETAAPPSAIGVLDPRLKTALLDAYGVSLAAAFGPPFSDALRVAEREYGWRRVAESGGGGLVLAAGSHPLPGVASVRAVDYSDLGAVVTIQISMPGRHGIILAGRELAANAGDVMVDEVAIGPAVAADGNWRRYVAWLGEGTHRLRLPWKSDALTKRSRAQADYLYFIGVINAACEDEYLRGASGSALGCCRDGCRDDRAGAAGSSSS
jgi:hypothetical protein